MHNLLVFVLLGLVAGAHSHGFLKSPIARTSIQTRPEFGTQQPYWWDNTGVWCNNVQQDLNNSQCGRCGEAAGNRDASQGGIYDKNVIVANYTAGSVITVVADMNAPHGGAYQIELCPQQTETDSCFQKLNILSGSENIVPQGICVPNGKSGDISAQVQLPAGVRCARCTLRWTYRTSYPGHGGTDCHNPQPAQTFRNCADISIN